MDTSPRVCGSPDGSYTSDLGCDDLDFSFNGDEFGTDFIRNPIDISSIGKLLESKCDELMKLIEIKPKVGSTNMKHEICSSDANNNEKSSEDKDANTANTHEAENNEDSYSDTTDVDLPPRPGSASDILKDAFSFAMQCSPATPAIPDTTTNDTASDHTDDVICIDDVPVTPDDVTINSQFPIEDEAALGSLINSLCSTPDSSFDNRSNGTSTPDSGFSSDNNCSLDPHHADMTAAMATPEDASTTMKKPVVL